MKYPFLRTVPFSKRRPSNTRTSPRTMKEQNDLTIYGGTELEVRWDLQEVVDSKSSLHESSTRDDL